MVARLSSTHLTGTSRLRTATVAGLPLAAAAVWWWDPARHGGPPLCPWRAVTGVACPGCGLTRAAGALLHGRVTDAWSLHPMVVPLVVQLALLWVLASLYRPPAATALARSPGRVMPLVFTANGVAFVAVWALRLAAGSLPPA